MHPVERPQNILQTDLCPLPLLRLFKWGFWFFLSIFPQCHSYLYTSSSCPSGNGLVNLKHTYTYHTHKTNPNPHGPNALNQVNLVLSLLFHTSVSVQG